MGTMLDKKNGSAFPIDETVGGRRPSGAASIGAGAQRPKESKPNTWLLRSCRECPETIRLCLTSINHFAKGGNIYAAVPSHERIDGQNRPVLFRLRVAFIHR